MDKTEVIKTLGAPLNFQTIKNKMIYITLKHHLRLIGFDQTEGEILILHMKDNKVKKIEIKELKNYEPVKFD